MKNEGISNLIYKYRFAAFLMQIGLIKGIMSYFTKFSHRRNIESRITKIKGQQIFELYRISGQMILIKGLTFGPKITYIYGSKLIRSSNI